MAPLLQCREPNTQPCDTPRMGPASQTDNLQSSGVISLLSFKGREDVPLVRKLAYQYVLNFVFLFLVLSSLK